MAKGASPRAKKSLKAHGRSLADFGELSAAEKKLVEACRLGEVCTLGDGKRPEKATAENTIRPGLIRFLVLGGDDDAPVHEKGVLLQGAWVAGTLDLDSCTCPLDICSSTVELMAMSSCVAPASPRSA